TVVRWLPILPSAASGHGSIGRWWYAVLPNHGHHAASHISPSLRRSCHGRRPASHVSAHHRRTGERRWISCGTCVCPLSASSGFSCARLLLSARPLRGYAVYVRPCVGLPKLCSPCRMCVAAIAGCHHTIRQVCPRPVF